jgi:hypothetical protein
MDSSSRGEIEAEMVAMMPQDAGVENGRRENGG